MKKAIYYIFIYVLPLLLLAYPLDWFISNNLKKSSWFASGEYLIWNDIYNGEINSDIVIYGSSTAWKEINPTMIGDSLNVNCYNLGIDGHNFWLEYFRHQEFLKNNPKPKVIILSVDALSLTRRANLYNYEQFLPYFFNDSIYHYTSMYDGFSYLDYKLPLVRYIGEERAINVSITNFLHLKKGADPIRVKGFLASDKTWTNDLEKAKAQMDSLHIVLDSISIKLFDRFINECKTNNIDIVFVFTPTQTEGQEFISNLREINLLYQKFADKYNIPYLNYIDDPICKQKEYFYNSAHLNKYGSTILTHKIINDLKMIESVRNIIP